MPELSFLRRSILRKNALLKKETVMKVLVLFLLVVLASVSSAEAFSCRPLGWKSKLRMKNKSITIEKESCVPTESSRYSEICHLGKNTLMVSANEKYPSIIVLENGIPLMMSCEHLESQEEQEEQEQSRQQGQQQQEAGDGPGHGGNTIGGKG